MIRRQTCRVTRGTCAPPNPTPATQRSYLDALRLLAEFLTQEGMPTDVAAISREHIEESINDRIARLKPASATASPPSARSSPGSVDEGEIRESPMARMRKPKLPEHAPPILKRGAAAIPTRRTVVLTGRLETLPGFAAPRSYSGRMLAAWRGARQRHTMAVQKERESAA